MPKSHEPDLTQLKAILVQARTRLGLSADDLADSAGVSRQTIFNISSGKHYGDLNTWLKISRALGVGLDELLADVWGDSGHGTRVG